MGMHLEKELTLSQILLMGLYKARGCMHKVHRIESVLTDVVGVVVFEWPRSSQHSSRREWTVKEVNALHIIILLLLLEALALLQDGLVQASVGFYIQQPVIFY